MAKGDRFTIANMLRQSRGAYRSGEHAEQKYGRVPLAKKRISQAREKLLEVEMLLLDARTHAVAASVKSRKAA